jgi:hypothetical protein
MFRYLRVTLLASGIFHALIGFSIIASAHATNGNVYGQSCANCSTTTQFTASAMAGAATWGTPGTYVVVSSTVPMTAYMQVTGLYGLLYGKPYFYPTAATPISASGSSLAGESEAFLESNYAALDVGLFGSRTNPKVVTVSSTYAVSIINSDDAEVGPGIDLALAAQGILWADLPVGFVITVNFQDGTSAQFIKDSNFSAHWVWTGVAHNKNKQPINRNGIVISNPNTAGIGAGQIVTPGFGSDGTTVTFSVSPGNLCTAAVTVGWDGDEFTDLGYFPC